MKHTTCTLDPELFWELQKAAAKSGRSMNQFLRTAIEQWAREHNVYPAPSPPPPRSRMGGWL